MSKPFCQSTARVLLLALGMTSSLAAQLRTSWKGRKGVQDPCKFYTPNEAHSCRGCFFPNGDLNDAVTPISEGRH